MRMQACGLAVVLGATPLMAQSEVFFEIDDEVLGPGESTTVRLWVAFPPSDHSLAGILTDVRSSVGSDGFSELSLISPLDGPGTSSGTPSTTGIDEIIAGQLMFPICGIAGCPMSVNPVAFWEATYTVPIDATPMLVELTTMTSRLDVYPELLNPRSESRLDGLLEGEATIRVVPAPAGAALIGLGGLLGRRRR